MNDIQISSGTTILLLVNYLFCLRPSNYIPAWILCLPCGEEMVGAILQAALARHRGHLPEGPGGGGGRGEERNSQNSEEDSHPLLHAGLHPLHQAGVSQA